jgi:hypothetical protein
VAADALACALEVASCCPAAVAAARALEFEEVVAEADASLDAVAVAAAFAADTARAVAAAFAAAEASE